MIRVLLVDDQELVRAGLRALLGNDAGIEVAGEAPDGRRAVTEACRLCPDVVLMDLRMPDVDGLEATAAITAQLPGTRVLVLTTFDEPGEIDAAVRAGAAGYLLKDTGADELRRAVHTVAAGGNLLSPTVARHLMDRLAAEDPPPAPDPRLAGLTERERQVLARVGLGETNQEIAAALFISPATARTYVSRLLARLRARDRTQLAVIALRGGIVPR
ncbi:MULTISPECIES: response regulator transcription factor [Catenuloplanes]|uniref:DNA-binding NarL/FixJ family response regulator n=1 Tax=Catenuloplanes niger TaxID=587534 RepID=A0AAE3ZT90_9ACTN|nr:response regulator transcription factor [Catenuloplanes niger]MDR7325261.1 DNA-binding NarL/FixJ family response regulator [Catenuloplanes niger]